MRLAHSRDNAFVQVQAMALLEDRTAVFIVRIWCEHGGGEDRIAAEWRGSIEHMRSGERVFFRHLENVLDFMQTHLRQIGIDSQQRFWERIASSIDSDTAQEPTATSPEVSATHLAPQTLIRKSTKSR